MNTVFKNPVYDYLFEKKPVCLSSKTLAKRLKLKHRKVLHYCKHEKLRKCNPIEVGTGKHSLNVYTIIM